jgi:acetyl-CoA carboxylase biotin carboxyl carrier protein
MDLKEIKSLIKLLEETDLAEIEVEESGRRIRVRKEQGRPATLSASLQSEAAAQFPVPQGSPVAQGLQPLPEASEQTEPNLAVIHSPIVGTFYRAHTQGAEAYVKVGDLVKKGQILCIVEAMKLMNEIESDHDGTIAVICVEDKSSVEFGQPLFKIDPLS